MEMRTPNLTAGISKEAKLELLAEARREHRGGIVILMPAFRAIHPEAAQSLIKLRGALEEIHGSAAVDILSGTLLPDAREELARRALLARAEVVVWMDADVFTPVDVGIRLVKKVKDRLWQTMDGTVGRLGEVLFLVGAPMPVRGGRPALNVRWLPTNTQPHLEILQLGGTHRVGGIGLALAAMPGAVFSVLPQPWFERPWNVRRGEYESEDLALCSKIRELEGHIFADFSLGGVAHHVEEARDLSWYVLRQKALEPDAGAKALARGVKLPKPPKTLPHQKGGAVEPIVDPDGSTGASSEERRNRRP